LPDRLIAERGNRNGRSPSGLPHQLWQLDDIRRDPSRLVFGEQLGCGSGAGFNKKAPTG